MEYYYRRPSLVTEDIEDSQVGINNDEPKYTLDVAGGDIAASNVLASSVAASTVVASNVTASNVVATRFLEGLTIDARSNLCWGGHSLYDPYPGDPTDWDDLIPFSGDQEGMIHASWIRKPLTAKDVLVDLWNIGETGLEIADFVLDNLMDKGALQAAALNAVSDALNNALDEEPSSSNTRLRVTWSNMMDVPVAATDTLLGTKGDIYTREGQSLKVVPAGNFTRNAQNNLQVSTANADTILDFATKEAYLRAVNIGSNVRVTDNSSNFRVHSWSFGSNTVHNSNVVYLRCTLSNVTACNIETHSLSNSSNSIALMPDACVIEHRAPDQSKGTVSLSKNQLKFTTTASNNDVIQASVDDKGSLYLRSNVLVPECATIRAYQSPGIDNDIYREGVLRVMPDKIGFFQASNNSETTWCSFNSNGLFLTQKASVFGRLEPLVYPNPVNPLETLTTSNFPRLDLSLNNGLVYGWGLSANFSNLDVFKVTRNGEMFMNNKGSSTLQMLVNSNAEIQKGSTILDNDGNLRVDGKVIVSALGTFTRRADPESTVGFQVSPSGYLTMGGFQVTPEGVLSTTKSMSVSNVNVLSSLIYSSNCSVWGSNTAVYGSNTASWGSNAAVYGSNTASWCSNAAVSGSNTAIWGSNAAVYGSNTAAWGSNAARYGSNTAAWGSNNLQYYAPTTHTHDSLYRSKATYVPWTEISGKPNFDVDSNGSFSGMSVAGVTMGAAGLAFGGYALLNQNGMLTNALASAAGNLRLNPSGYSRFDDGIDIGASLRLDPSGFANFQGARFGAQSIHLSNDQVIITSPGSSNVLLSSNVSFFKTGNVGIGTTAPTDRLHVNGTIRTNGLVNTGGLGLVMSNSTVNNGNQLTIVNQCAPSNSIIYTFIQPVQPTGDGSGYVILGGFGYSNGASRGHQPLSVMYSKLGVGLSNPASQVDVAGDVACTGSFIEGGQALGIKYASSNSVGTLSNAHHTYSNAETSARLTVASNVATLSNAHHTYSNAETSARLTVASNVTTLSNAHVSFSNAETSARVVVASNLVTLSNAHVSFSNAETSARLIVASNLATLSNAHVSFSNAETSARLALTSNVVWCSNSVSQGNSYWQPGYVEVYNGIVSPALRCDYNTSTAGHAHVDGLLQVTGSMYEGGNALSAKYAPSNHAHADKYWISSNSLVVTGSNTRANNVFVGNFGHVGSFFGGMSHIDRANVTDYAFLQGSDGTTFINAPTGREVIFRINNSDKMLMNAAGLNIYGEVAADSKIVLNNSAIGIYLRSGTSNDYYWRIRNWTESDGLGNLDFYTCRAGVESRVAYIEDDVSATNRLNFTQGHRVVAPGITAEHVGLIVCSTGVYDSLLPVKPLLQRDHVTIDEAVPTVRLSNKRKERSVFGIVASMNETDTDDSMTFQAGAFTSVMKKPVGDSHRVFVNAVGEGAMWVVDTGGDLENGDYIQSSAVPGYGERQSSAGRDSHTVAKVTCDVDFKAVDIEQRFHTRVVDGRKAAFVGVVYCMG